MRKNNILIAVGLSLALVMSQCTGAFAADSITNSNGAQTQSQPTVKEMLKGRDYVKDQLIVTYNEGVTVNKIKSSVAGKDAVCEDVAKVSDEQKAAQVTISNDDSMKDAIQKFQKDSRVESVQPNYKYTVTDDDPYINSSGNAQYQYQFEDTHAKAAWTLLNGTANRTKVAVIDTGVDPSHEDLQKNCDFSNGTYMEMLDGNTIDAKDDVDLTDGHGTHVTGIIGATYGNGKGGSGIASGYNNNLVEVKTIGVQSEDGGLYTFDVVNAINYAVNKYGAKVINMSFGGSGRDRVLEKAIIDGYNKGTVFVAASGNDGSNKLSNPADMKEVIAVNASDSSNNVMYWSDYGQAKDITAPGDAILSTTPGDCYKVMSGTSMAAPVVTGIAALVLDADPNLTPEQVYNIICATSSVNNGKSTATFNDNSAYGIVDAEAAVEAAQNAKSEIDATTIYMKQQDQNVSVYAGDDYGLEALVLPATSLKNITWTSSDTNTAIVDSDGVVTGVTPGQATITATAGAKSTKCTVTVKTPVAATSISIGDKLGDDQLAIGEEQQLSASISPANVSNDEVYWTSSDRSVVKVDEIGYVTGMSSGTATITAKTYNGMVSSSYTVSVKKPVNVIKFTSSTNWMQLGDTYQFKAQAYDANGGTDPAHGLIHWFSSYKKYATVNESTGLVTPKHIGKLYIIAYDSTGTKKVYKRITIAKKNYSGKKDYKLRCVKKGTKYVKLKWNRISIADGYVVQRAASRNGNYKTVKKIKKGSCVSFKNTKLKSGKTYYYKVKATYVKNGAGKSFSYSNKLKVIA